jgi:hypothetical protein
MKRLSFLLLIFAFSVIPAFAFDEFTTDYRVRYQVLSSGRVKVNQEVTLTNKLSSIYASQYSLVLEGSQIENVQASDELGPLKIEINKDQNTTIILTFNQKAVGLNKSLNFNLSYEALDLAQNNGQVWEITVPRLSNDSPPDNFTLELAVPKSFGSPAYIRPVPIATNEDDNFHLYQFSKSQLLYSGISAVFGDFQLFDFKLSYHLENPYPEIGETEIALPPDTAFQQVAYQKITPEPLTVRIDEDGNWLARYRLEANQKYTVLAEGQVKIFSQPKTISFTDFDKEVYLQPQKYWETDNILIQATAKKFKTPRQIYDYVIKTLDYDYDRVRRETERQGALRALQNPVQSICMEFTDLFIALARAAGIPAREINGFAYTTNERLRPLGLEADVLHSWPEYWNEEKKLWTSVDPTWGKTTGGIDYFTEMDLNHFAFVIHGLNSETPYPAGSYKNTNLLSKDVEVVFGRNPLETPINLKVDFKIPKQIFWGLKTKGQIVVKNKGSIAVNETEASVSGQNLDLFFSKNNKIIIPTLPPFSKATIELSLKPAGFFTPTIGNLILQANQEIFSQQVKINYWLPILILFVVSLCLVSLLFLLTRRFVYGKKRR